MNGEMIEEKDLLLLKKIREIIKTKEIIPEEKPEIKPVWQRQGFCFLLVILCAGGILTGLMTFREGPPIVASNNSEQGIEAFVEESKSMVVTKIADPVALAGTETLEPAPEIHPKETPPSMEIVQPEKETLPQEDILPPEVSAETRARVQPNPTEQTGISSGIQISEIVSCGGIANKQYVSPQKVFSLKKESTPVIWMNVLSDKQPFTLTHVYYVNGGRYCAVPLQILYKKMRTWSNVSLKYPAHIGEWRVEVMTDKGEKLDQIEFTVVP